MKAKIMKINSTRKFVGLQYYNGNTTFFFLRTTLNSKFHNILALKKVVLLSAAIFPIGGYLVRIFCFSVLNMSKILLT